MRIELIYVYHFSVLAHSERHVRTLVVIVIIVVAIQERNILTIANSFV